nr:MAG: hypothetical protein 4 [Henan cystovirus 2]
MSKLNSNKAFMFHNPKQGSFGYPITATQYQGIKATHTIVDRFAGASVVEKICGKEPNVGVVAHNLKSTGIRTQVAEFFLSNQPYGIIKSVLATQTVRKGEPQTTIDALIKAIAANVKDVRVRNIVSEFIIPLAYARGLIAGSTEMTLVMEYPKSPVTVNDLSMELAAQAAAVEFKLADSEKHFTERMAKEAYAQAFAEALRPIGFEMHSARNVQHILDDIVKAIFVRLMSPSRPDMIGTLDDSWLHSPVVVELSGCYTFIEAALQLGAKSPKGPRNITVKNDAYMLDREAPAVLARLKGARRYSFVSRDEFLSTYGKVSVKDLDGTPMYFVLYENAAIQQVAQALNVFDDAVLPGVAKNVLPGEEHIMKYIASAIPKTDSVSTAFHANRILTSIEHAIQSGDFRLTYPIQSTDEEGNQVELSTVFTDSVGIFLALEQEDAEESLRRELAWMFSDEVLLGYDSDSMSVTTVYRTKTSATNHRKLEWMAGLDQDGHFISSDEGAILLMGRDVTPTAYVSPRSQLISESVFNTRVLGLSKDEDRLIKEQELAFNVPVGGERLSGRISTFEIGLQDVSQYTSFVRALHNDKVAKTISRAYDFLGLLEEGLTTLATHPVSEEDAGEFGSTVVTHQLVSFLQQRRVESLVQMSQDVSQQYRSVVRTIMQSSAMKTMKPDQVYRLRGILKQKSFEVYSDLVALQALFTTCGFEAEYIIEAMKSNDLANVILRVA